MRKFIVHVSYTTYEDYEVQAESVEEAEGLYWNEDLVPASSTCDDTTISVEPVDEVRAIKLTPFNPLPVYFTDEEGNKWATVVNVNCTSQCCVCGKWFTSGYAKLTPEFEDTGSLAEVAGYYCEKEVQIAY